MLRILIKRTMVLPDSKCLALITHIKPWVHFLISRCENKADICSSYSSLSFNHCVELIILYQLFLVYWILYYLFLSISKPISLSRFCLSFFLFHSSSLSLSSSFCLFFPQFRTLSQSYSSVHGILSHSSWRNMV